MFLRNFPTRAADLLCEVRIQRESAFALIFFDFMEMQAKIVP